MIVGLQASSPLRRALGAAPLVALGAISYGVYLYHWPVYVLLDTERTGLPPLPLFALRITVTLTLAVVSYRALERPIRARRLRWRPVIPTAVAACASIGIVAAIVPVDSTPYWMAGDREATAATLAPVDSVTELRPLAAAPTTSTAATPTTAEPTTSATAPITPLAATTTTAAVPPVAVPPALPTGLSRPVRILVVGDSTAVATGNGMLAWAATHPDVARVAVEAAPGCGFIRDGVVPTDRDDGFRRDCTTLRTERIPAALSSLQPDAVVGMVTFRDIEDRLWDDAEGPIGPSDDRFLARLVEDYDAATQSFLAAGATDVLWVLAPMPAVPSNTDTAAMLEPLRYAHYSAAMQEVAARHPGQASVVDLAAWFAAQPVPPVRPDGLHWSPEAAEVIATDFLGPVAAAAAVS